MNEREEMLTSILDCKRSDLFAKNINLNKEQEERLNQMISRRSKGEPLQYVVGDVSFMGHKLFVNPSVLIPRPETEILVEAILKILSNKKDEPLRILDIGTGSANISIGLAKFFINSKITAIDVSTSAIAVAKRNILFHRLENKIELVCEDVQEYFKRPLKEEPFDLIVSNPPYIQTCKLDSLPLDVRCEPQVALNGGWDGLVFYRMIVRHAERFLKNKGFLFLEIGDNQDENLMNYLTKAKVYSEIAFVKDYVGTNRIVWTKKKD